MNYITV